MENKERNEAEANAWLCATGDVVAGDTIRFTEGVFEGSYLSPRHVGDRNVTAEIVRDSYGAARHQHTYTLRIVESSGTQPLALGTVTCRKERNICRNGTQRMRWDDESARDVVRAKRDEWRKLNLMGFGWTS